MMGRYHEALQELNVESNTLLYIASGIFQTEPDFAKKYLQKWSRRIVHRNMLLSPEETASLDVEQLGAIDFQVVSRASKFIGWQVWS